MMRNADCLIVADAVNAGAPPGTRCASPTRRSPPSFRPSCPTISSACPDLLALLAFKGETPRHVAHHRHGAAPARQPSGLGEPAAEGLDDMVGMFVDELAQVGVVATPPRRSARRPLAAARPSWNARRPWRRNAWRCPCRSSGRVR